MKKVITILTIVLLLSIFLVPSFASDYSKGYKDGEERGIDIGYDIGYDDGIDEKRFDAKATITNEQFVLFSQYRNGNNEYQKGFRSGFRDAYAISYESGYFDGEDDSLSNYDVTQEETQQIVEKKSNIVNFFDSTPWGYVIIIGVVILFWVFFFWFIARKG